MVFNWFRRQYNDSSQITSDKQQEEKTSPKEDTNTSSAETSTPETENSSDSAVDYLVWAKAAYKNIQEKQQVDEPATQATQEASQTLPETTLTENSSPNTQTTPSVTEVSETGSPETTQDLSDISVDSTVEQTATTPPKTQITPSVTQTSQTQTPRANQDLSDTSVENTVEQTVTHPEAIEEIKPDSTTSEEKVGETGAPAKSETREIPQANLSFLQRAAAERQAKQERLIANAIEIAPTEPATEEVVSESTTQADSNVEPSEIPGMAFDDNFLWSAEILAAQGRRPEDISAEEITWLKKLRQGLGKTRRGIVNQLKSIVGQGPLNQAGVEEIEALLLQADVGVEATDFIINSLQEKLRQEALPPEQAIAYLKQILRDLLDAPLGKSAQSVFAPEKHSFNIWLINGVNGAGKTTTIGKISHLAQKSGYKCLIGAADTFRAAAVEQVKVWGERSGVEVISNPGKNTDPAAVVFDAISAAKARETELLLIDTAGRLQNKKNLMEELSKIRRIIDKKATDAQVESLLVLDATLGQNGLRQAQVFSQAAQLTGVVLTKLDGTAKGGVALAVVKQLGLPIRFIGAGEGIEDLRPFSSYEFVEALLSS